MRWKPRRKLSICTVYWLFGLIGLFLGASRCGWAKDIVESLFHEEIAHAAEAMEWHGEPLSRDTLYALAATGISWEPFWGRAHLFWMGWARCDRKDLLDKKNKQVGQRFAEIEASYASQDWGHVVDLATRDFSFRAITCNPDLKLAVGESFLQLDRPERAFPVLASAYQAERMGRGGDAILEETDWKIRRGAFEAARAAHLTKEAVVFGLSLLFQPSAENSQVDHEVLTYLEQQGVSIERVALGILQAPARLTGLPAYSYVAADLLAMRPRPELLPVFMAMSQSGDVYLRARALIGLAALAYQPNSNMQENPFGEALPFTPTVTGLSADQRAQIEDMALRAIHDGNYRLRAAGVLALGLIGGEENRASIVKLERDPACYVIPTGVRGLEQLRFPVREAVALALKRWGVTFDPGDGTYSGRALVEARRRTRDVTHDFGGINRSMVSALLVFPFDTPLPLSPVRF
ncbi:hypothetical protein CP488_01870 [Chthonomonas calidirosea]|nr:hypothetical protein CP488_01870 [Chthonomonas calidirosea]